MSFLTTLPQQNYRADAFSAFNAGGHEFDLGTANAMAWMCQLAYETANSTKAIRIADQWGLTIPPRGIISEEIATVLPRTSTQLVVATRGGVAIIAFAGTDPLSLADWITNFDLGIASESVGNGFAVAVEAIWGKVEALLQDTLADLPIFFTGHSLGGALAVRAAQRINGIRANSVRAIYTFGMPRPGDANFAVSYNQIFGSRTYRLVHGNDLVATIAPTAMGFRHVGRLLHCVKLKQFDPASLEAIGSDEPRFVKGTSNELTEFIHRPLSSILSLGARYGLASALTFGVGPPGMRSDPGGIAIELLPPRLRDHMPDRYIRSTSRP